MPSISAWPEAGDEWSDQWGSSRTFFFGTVMPRYRRVRARRGHPRARALLRPLHAVRDRHGPDLVHEDRAREPLVEPLMVTQKRDAIRDRQVAEGEEPPA